MQKMSIAEEMIATEQEVIHVLSQFYPDTWAQFCTGLAAVNFKVEGYKLEKALYRGICAAYPLKIIEKLEDLAQSTMEHLNVSLRGDSEGVGEIIGERLDAFIWDHLNHNAVSALTYLHYDLRRNGIELLCAIITFRRIALGVKDIPDKVSYDGGTISLVARNSDCDRYREYERRVHSLGGHGLACLRALIQHHIDEHIKAELFSRLTPEERLIRNIGRKRWQTLSDEDRQFLRDALAGKVRWTRRTFERYSNLSERDKRAINVHPNARQAQDCILQAAKEKRVRFVA